MFHRSLTVRVTGFMALTYTLVAIGQLSALRAGLTAGALSGLLCPLVFGALLSSAGVSLIARRAIGVLERAIRQIAEGDYRARLPRPVNRDFEVVQRAFTEMAQALDRAMEGLREGDRQRRRMFADLAHELATPAGTVIGLADTLARKDLCPDEATRARMLSALSDEAMRLGTLIHDLSDLAHMEDPEVIMRREPTDLGDLVQRVVGLCGLGSGEASIECAPAPRALVASLDPARIEQVVHNLLSNARRYTPPGGRIGVSVGGDQTDVWLVVQDSGPGVPDELLGRLGERLLRADPSRDRRTGGHGLGLSIVRAIVGRHSGRVEFANAPGGGLRVSVRLPVVDQTWASQ